MPRTKAQEKQLTLNPPLFFTFYYCFSKKTEIFSQNLRRYSMVTVARIIKRIMPKRLQPIPAHLDKMCRQEMATVAERMGVSNPTFPPVKPSSFYSNIKMPSLWLMMGLFSWSAGFAYAAASVAALVIPGLTTALVIRNIFKNDFGGRYFSNKGYGRLQGPMRIELSPGLEEEQMRFTIRHEYAHHLTKYHPETIKDDRLAQAVAIIGTFEAGEDYYPDHFIFSLDRLNTGAVPRVVAELSVMDRMWRWFRCETRASFRYGEQAAAVAWHLENKTGDIMAAWEFIRQLAKGETAVNSYRSAIRKYRTSRFFHY